MKYVREILEAKQNQEVATIAHDKNVLEAAQMMNERRIGSLVVKEGNEVVGIFTERDVLRRVVAELRDPNKTYVKDVMTAPCVIAKPEEEIEKCQLVMTQMRIRHLPVLKGGQLVGMLTAGDIMSRTVRERAVEIQYLHDYLYGGTR